MRTWLRTVRRSLREAGERFRGGLHGTVVGVQMNHPMVALTFDDGPHPVTTPRVLEVLARHGAMATFFMVGREARRYPELVAQVAAAGHAIGHHTLDHVSLPGLPADALQTQVMDGYAAVGPECARLFRPPWGHLDLAAWRVARNAGHEVIAWSGHVFDWLPQDAALLTDRLKARLEPGAIVLLHDAPQVGDPEGEPREALLAALDGLLETAGSEWRFVTVPQLLAAGRPRRRVRWRRAPEDPGAAARGIAGDARDAAQGVSGEADAVVADPTVPAISVVIPVLDAEDTLADQLDALARQRFGGAWELIVADNGSRDRGLDVARAYADRLPLKVVDASAVPGASHARNVGARAARAPLLAFVDADDEVADDWLDRIVSALGSHAAVASRFDKERLNPPKLRATRDLAQEKGLGGHNYAAFLPHAGGSGLAVRRAVHEAIGGFDERLLRLEDTDYCWRLQLAGHELHFESEAVLHVRFRPEGRAADRQAFAYGRYNGHLYHRYRNKGMGSAPVMRDLKLIVIVGAKVLFGRDPVKRAKRRRMWLHRVGILVGRLEARLRHGPEDAGVGPR